MSKKKPRVPSMKESTAWYIKHRQHWTRLSRARARARVDRKEKK